MSRVPIIAHLPIPELYFRDKKERRNLRLIVRETFWTVEPIPVAKRKAYIHQTSLGKPKKRIKTVSRRRKVLYNAPINWKSKRENLVIKKERNQR